MGNSAALVAADAEGQDGEHQLEKLRGDSSGALGSEVLAPICCQCDKRMEERARAALELHLPGASVPSGGGGALSGAAGIVKGVNEVDKSRYYREWDSIKGALVGGDTVLIRGTYMENMFMSSNFLPRWQDLPPSAAWDAEELLRDVQDPARPTPKIVAISHSWLSREHADPEGFLLKQIAPLLKHYARQQGIGVESLAIFIDWCSLPQRPWSEPDQRAHQRAMRNIDIWYAHTLTDVWCCSRLPEGSHVPYEDRGWTRLERAAGSMLCPSESTLDLGLITDDWKAWDQVVAACKVQRRPSLLPEEFTRDLESKSFAYPEDKKVVAHKYWGIFHRAFGTAEHLSYEGVEWGDSEAMALAKVLPHCAGLQELSVRSNKIESMGALALAEAMPESVRHLDLTDNAIGEATQQDLIARWAVAQRPEVGLAMDSQRPTSLTTEEERAAFEQFRPVPLSPRLSASSVRTSFNKQGVLDPDSNRTLNALLARQAAFEARIESAMAKVAENVAELSREVNVPTSTTGAASARAREARVAALAALGVEAGSPQRSNSGLPQRSNSGQERSSPRKGAHP